MEVLPTIVVSFLKPPREDTCTDLEFSARREPLNKKDARRAMVLNTGFRSRAKRRQIDRDSRSVQSRSHRPYDALITISCLMAQS